MPLIDSIEKVNDVFVETGTYLGAGIDWALSKGYSKIYSVELAQTYYDNARKAHSDKAHVHIIRGDSSLVLGDLLSEIAAPCDIWLDGHFMERDPIQVKEIPEKNQNEGPIIDELLHIKNHYLRERHIVMVDDMRHFIVHYPQLATKITELILSMGFCITWLDNKNIIQCKKEIK